MNEGWLKPIPMRNDPMGFVMDFHQFLFANRFVGPLVYGSCLFYATIGSIAFFHLYMYDGMDYLLKYAIIPFTSPWALTTAYTEYVWIQPLLAIYSKTHYWDVETASEPKKAEIKKHIKISRLICMFFIVESSINGIFGFIIGYVGDFCSDMYFMEVFFSDNTFLRLLGSFISSISHSIVTLTSISIYLVLKYFSSTCRVQLQLLSDFLERVNVYKADDHDAIRHHLKLCAFQHSMLLQQFAQIQEVIYVPLIPSSVSASIAVFGCLISMYFNRNVRNILSVLLLQSLVSIILIDCCESGQDLEDAFAEFSSHLTKVEWYDWNEENKKTLLIMLNRGTKEEKLQALGISFNRTLLIMITKSAYQIFVVLQGRF